MCCLFGIIDYKNSLSAKQMNKVVSILSRFCEARGTDATGISYIHNDNLCIYKRPLPARKIRYAIPSGVHTVMGHTRMTTQGNERKNYNNHPFLGKADNTEFSLAHNGVLRNDSILRRKEKLPYTKIETDSYIAVQLLEKQNALNFDSLKYMAEKLEGSFSITVLDKDSNLYFIKGDNPLCLYHFEKLGIYIYASTEEILKEALKRIPYDFGVKEKVTLLCGDILKIDKFGNQSEFEFNTDNLFSYFYPYSFGFTDFEEEYIKELKYTAKDFGFAPEYIDLLIEDGYTTEDIEEMLYCS